LTFGLAGCGSNPDVSTSVNGAAQTVAGSDADIATLANIVWETDSDGVPQLTFDVPLSVASSVARLIGEGTGKVIQLGDLLQIDYTVTSDTDVSVIYSTDDTGAPELLPLIDGQVDPVLMSIFVGHKVGSTVIFIPTTEPPADLVAQLLIKGTGATVTDGQAVTAHYTGWLWDGTQFDSSWDLGTPRTAKSRIRRHRGRRHPCGFDAGFRRRHPRGVITALNHLLR
jgi:hypothetical protein